MKFNDEKKQVLTQCYNCGNKGWLDIVGSHYCNFAEEDESTGQPIFIETIHYILSICPICQNAILISRYHCDGMMSFQGEDAFEDRIIYPNVTIDINDRSVPTNIRTAFESALKIEKIDIALCLTALRRTLEQICKDRGSTKKTLDAKVKELVDAKILPETFNDACWMIRQLGNEGAHGGDISIQRHYLKQVIEFMELIINHLYVLPARVSHLKETIEKAKEEKKSK